MIENIPQNVVTTIYTIFAVLGIATILVILKGVFLKADDHEELVQRIKSWWIIISLFSVAVVLDRPAAIAFLGFVSFLAFKEYISLVPTRRIDRPVLFYAYLIIPIQYFWVYDYWYGMFIVFIPVWSFLILPVRAFFTGDTGGFLRSAGTLHWGLMLTVFCLSHAAYMLSLPKINNPLAGNVGLLMFLVILTQINDVAQYIWGRSIGGPKIVPKVSPGKTWAGFLGGVVTTTVAGYFIAPYLTPFDGYHLFAVGAIIAIAGFLGDVTVSAFKRDMGVKNSSNLIPGHGGILDRVDSLTFSAPVFFHYIFYFYYGTPMLS
jgi:phosphatidate cytidylyltransferase